MKASEFLEKLEKIDLEKLQNEKGVGKVLSQNLQDFLASPRFKKLKSRFLEVENDGQGVEVLVQAGTIQNGKSVCITGTFEASRDVLKERLEAAGFKVISTVSKNTDFLLAGESAGSKLEKAQKLGVKIIKKVEEILN